MTMTRQHFNALAEAIRFSALNSPNRLTVAEEIAQVCGQFNPRFDRGRFIAAAMDYDDLDKSDVGN